MIQTNVGTEKTFAYAGTLEKSPKPPIQIPRRDLSGACGAPINTFAPTADVSTITSQHTFRLARIPYLRTFLRSLLLLSTFLTSAFLAALLGAWMWSTYSHTFVPYLKWQDALVASAEYLALVSLLGCVMILRFLVALHAGHQRSMLTIVDTHASVSSSITVRDLSHKNLSGIARAICADYSCFLAVLAALLPEMLIGWTLHLPHLALAILATAAVIVLAIAALVVALPSFSFIIIAWIGSISFTRKLGAAHTYRLTSATTLMISDLELVVIYPDAPEAVIDLNLLDPKDQRHLLYFLRKRWLDAQYPWNPRLGEEIELALQEAQHFTSLV